MNRSHSCTLNRCTSTNGLHRCTPNRFFLQVTRGRGIIILMGGNSPPPQKKLFSYRGLHTLPYTTHIRNIIVSSFSLFLLQFDRNTSDWSFLNTPHQMCHKPSPISIVLLIKNTTTTNPAILFLSGLLGIIAISSHTLLLVWKSRVNLV